jgi:hypothetical protein
MRGGLRQWEHDRHRDNHRHGDRHGGGGRRPTIPLRLTGPVSTTASITLGTGTTKNRLVTFKTPDGNFVVRHTKTKVGHELMIMCKVKYLTTATYTVLGSRGTGKFTGAKGGGKLSITFQGNLPKLSNDQCESTKIRPAEKGAVIMFHASGPLTVGKYQG